jgi:hypothetical protein
VAIPAIRDEHYEREHRQRQRGVRIGGRATYANYRRYMATGRLMP